MTRHWTSCASSASRITGILPVLVARMMGSRPFLNAKRIPHGLEARDTGVPIRAHSCLSWVFVFALVAHAFPIAAAPFVISVVDDQTNRGVSLVELTTVNNVRFVTDSAGLAAVDDVDLLDRKIFF